MSAGIGRRAKPRAFSMAAFACARSTTKLSRRTIPTQGAAPLAKVPTLNGSALRSAVPACARTIAGSARIAASSSTGTRGMVHLLKSDISASAGALPVLELDDDAFRQAFADILRRMRGRVAAEYLPGLALGHRPGGLSQRRITQLDGAVRGVRMRRRTLPGGQSHTQDADDVVLEFHGVVPAIGGYGVRQFRRRRLRDRRVSGYQEGQRRQQEAGANVRREMGHR